MNTSEQARKGGFIEGVSAADLGGAGGCCGGSGDGGGCCGEPAAGTGDSGGEPAVAPTKPAQRSGCCG